ncbi:MAG: hypothetical protein VXW87_03735, partial [Pseudomonadota bacterium]|nr:hypothetical protein [Pseudomonadota bacterium]
HQALKNLGFNAEQIVKMVSNNGGSKTLEAVTSAYESLRKCFEHDFILKLASQPTGSRRLYNELKRIDAANTLISIWPEVDETIIDDCVVFHSASSLGAFR